MIINEWEIESLLQRWVFFSCMYICVTPPWAIYGFYTDFDDFKNGFETDFENQNMDKIRIFFRGETDLSDLQVVTLKVQYVCTAP